MIKITKVFDSQPIVYQCIRRWKGNKSKLTSEVEQIRSRDSLGNAFQENFSTNGLRYQVCHERVPVHKTVNIKRESFEEFKAAINLRNLQPSMLPHYYIKTNLIYFYYTKYQHKFVCFTGDLGKVTTQLITQMQEKDVLFKKMFDKIFFGGSYYDNLKVGKPEEYDLDFLLNFPEIAEPVVEVSDKAGFVNVLINNFDNISNPSNQEKKSTKYESLLVDSKYLSTKKVLNWFESVIDQALKEFKKFEGEGYIFKVKLEENDELDIYGTTSKCFPAFTLKLKSKEKMFNLDIDLVPCFQFSDDNWPKGSYKPNPYPSKNKFLVVPKSPYSLEGEKIVDIEKYWRLSFQEQERVVFTGNHFNNLKVVLRLLKTLRDHNKHYKIASYFIKTMFLWEVHEREKNFWSQSMSIVFMEMLKKYEKLLREKRIRYYWNEEYNLIGHLKDSTVMDIANFLKKVINNIDRKIEDDPFVIANYVLSEEELNVLREEVDVGKKNRKLLSYPSSTVETIENNEQFKKMMDSIDLLHKKMDILLNFNEDLENKINRIDEKVEIVNEKVEIVNEKLSKIRGILYLNPTNQHLPSNANPSTNCQIIH